LIDKAGMTIGRKDQAHCTMTERSIVVGKSEADSAKIIAAIGSREEVGFVLLQAKDQVGSIGLNSNEAKLGWANDGQGHLVKRK
jgi:hypothetical protein